MNPDEKILRKLNFMQKCVDYLKSVDAGSKELEANYELRSAVERNFQLAIESSIDIGEMIISREGFERPDFYRNVFLILGKNNVIPSDFAEEFSKAAGFRNVLVHIYEDINIEILYTFLTERLEGFDEFAGYIAEYLNKKS
ncbi:DUF86 domain-containing protein [uncultured Methanolobus sp.]|uniref:type VII toxin-antitoxin system HepT family RNase toxin n=1 Tax=uncultured Methanolobus sp. TaxID=218300 RepID=UPI002AAA99AA|nr:DUF86 domain-containing protein [uncultured Methanolobus sp.]